MEWKERKIRMIDEMFIMLNKILLYLLLFKSSINLFDFIYDIIMFSTTILIIIIYYRLILI